MNHKMLSAAGCLLLLAAAMVPTALGHNDRVNGDTSVYGTFYGPAGYFVEFNGPEVDDPTSSDPADVISTDFTSAAGSMLCDMEVLGDGTSHQEPDESRVEGHATGVGQMLDGTFDDGGQGGVCHTGHYAHQDYNTLGCVDDGARANNVAPLAAPWLGTTCDWKTVEGGTPQTTILTGCLINGILDGIEDQPGEAIACVLAFVECTANPLTCADDGTESCGYDSVADAINFGAGNSRVPYPAVHNAGWRTTGAEDTPLGESYGEDGILSSCAATMAVFTFDAVRVTDNGLPNAPTVAVNPAVQGLIWQVA
ncbi:MAG: hypothetical protein ACYC2H_04910 [Thermoplasmatota archaeon]